jgi:MFS family permease
MRLHAVAKLTLRRSLGTTVAIYEVGCAIGALTCAFIGDILGRRRTIFIAGWIVIVGVVLQSTAFSLGQLIASRVITGSSTHNSLPAIFAYTVPRPKQNLARGSSPFVLTCCHH